MAAPWPAFALGGVLALALLSCGGAAHHATGWATGAAPGNLAALLLPSAVAGRTPQATPRGLPLRPAALRHAGPSQIFRGDERAPVGRWWSTLSVAQVLVMFAAVPTTIHWVWRSLLPRPSATTTEHSTEVAALRSALGAGAVTAMLCAHAALAQPSADLIAAASAEPDPEIAVELWDAVLAASPRPEAAALAGRGKANLALARWAEAEKDLGVALGLMDSVPPNIVVSDAAMAAKLLDTAVLWDCRGVAQARLGDLAGALNSFQQALGLVGLAGMADAPVPASTPYAGLRGGAPTMAQRIELNRAFALAGAAQWNDAVVALRLIDKGPDPDGFPQFWDARAALAIALSAAGQPIAAEAEWADLCRGVPTAPPAVPNNLVLSQVNRAAQLMLDVQGAFTDQGCEDYNTGVYLPCNDAGIPGLGGSSAPCALYTPEEARLRQWPPALVAELDRFRALGPGPARP